MIKTKFEVLRKRKEKSGQLLSGSVFERQTFRMLPRRLESDTVSWSLLRNKISPLVAKFLCDLSTYLPTYLSTYLSVCLFIYLFLYAKVFCSSVCVCVCVMDKRHYFEGILSSAAMRSRVEAGEI